MAAAVPTTSAAAVTTTLSNAIRSKDASAVRAIIEASRKVRLPSSEVRMAMQAALETDDSLAAGWLVVTFRDDRTAENALHAAMFSAHAQAITVTGCDIVPSSALSAAAVESKRLDASKPYGARERRAACHMGYAGADDALRRLREVNASHAIGSPGRDAALAIAFRAIVYSLPMNEVASAVDADGCVIDDPKWQAANPEYASLLARTQKIGISPGPIKDAALSFYKRRCEYSKISQRDGDDDEHAHKWLDPWSGTE